MLDPSEKVRINQAGIFMAKPIMERFFIGMEMIDFGLNFFTDGLRHENPKLSDIELIILRFKRNYSRLFTIQEAEKISKKIDLYHQQKIANDDQNLP